MRSVIRTLLSLGIATLLIRGVAFSQIPVEIFMGNEKSTIDLMFFKYFKNGKGGNSRFLFFNRNRASVDYRITSKEWLPQFGFTEAVSYNLPLLKGFAPVAVGQVFNTGVYPKAGIQYYISKGSFTVFTWLITETLSRPTIDYYLLSRFEPSLTDKLGLFVQAEFVNGFPTDPYKKNTFVQRIRIGLRSMAWQYGIGSDFTETENDDYAFHYNAGIFFRYNFK
jgi:hypothetical protein